MIDIRSFRDVLRLFFIYRREFVLAFTSTIFFALLGSVLLAPRYVSEARLLVKQNKNEVQTTVQVDSQQELIDQSTVRDPILDEEKILTSASVIQDVATTLQRASAKSPQNGMAFKSNLQTSPSALKRAMAFFGLTDLQSPTDQLAGILAKSFAESHDPGAAVIEMRVTWSNPANAQEIARSWIDAYFLARAKAAGGAQLSDFYEKQSHLVGAKLIALREAMHNKLNSIDASGMQQRLDSISEQLQRLYQQRQDAMSERRADQGISHSTQQRLLKLPNTIVTDREIGLNPSTQDLGAKLNNLLAQRADLLREYRDDAPQIKAIDSSISGLRTQISDSDTNIQKSESIAPNPLATKLKQDMLDAQTHVDQLGEQIKAYDSQVAQLQKERDLAMSTQPELEQLSLDLASAEKNYALYTENLAQAQALRDINSNRLSNVAVIQEPTFNSVRVSPRPLLLLLGSLPAGLCVGLLALLVCHILDQRVYDEAPLAVQTGKPIWATLPATAKKDGGSLGSFEVALYNIYRQLPLNRISKYGVSLGLASATANEGITEIIEPLRKLIQAQGTRVRVSAGELVAPPGEVLLIPAPSILDDLSSITQLRQADKIALVVRAGYTTIPVAQRALATLEHAFGAAHGIILCQCRLAIPTRILRLLARTWNID